MKSFSLVRKDLQIFLKDRGAVVQLFLLPLLFIAVFSGAYSSLGEEEDTRILLPVVDLDGGQAAQTLLEGITADGGVRIEEYGEQEARALLDENELHRALIIPEDFTTGMAAGDQVTLRLINHPDANSEEAEAVRLVVEGVARDLGLERQIVASLELVGAMMGNSPQDFQVFGTERIVAQARDQFERAQDQPLVSVVQSVPRQDVDEGLSMEDVTPVSGFAVLFVFLTAQATAHSIYDEKRFGSFRRLLAAPMSKAALLAGKILPNLITGLIQMVVIFAFGIFGLQLIGLPPASLGNDPLAVVLAAVLIALCSSALGILIAAIARTESQIGGLSSLLLWGAGIVGGCVIPLFLLEGFLGPLPMIVPHYWANRAFDDLILRGLGLAGVTTELAVLLGFTVLFFAVGLWLFDFD